MALHDRPQRPQEQEHKNILFATVVHKNKNTRTFCSLLWYYSDAADGGQTLADMRQGLQENRQMTKFSGGGLNIKQEKDAAKQLKQERASPTACCLSAKLVPPRKLMTTIGLVRPLWRRNKNVALRKKKKNTNIMISATKRSLISATRRSVTLHNMLPVYFPRTACIVRVTRPKQTATKLLSLRRQDRILSRSHYEFNFHLRRSVEIASKSSIMRKKERDH